jgi:glycosyltransferase involved in cell wall biosynthesis
MKVLLVAVGHYHDNPGGAPKVVFEEAEELRRRGEEVWVLAHGESSLPEYEQKDGINFLRYTPAKVSFWNPARRFAHQKAAAAVLARHLPQVDAIHGHIQLAYLAALDFYGDSVHSCYTIHSPAKMEMAIVWRNSCFLRRVTAPIGLKIINRMEEQCLRRSNVVTALSQYTIDCISRIHGKELSKVVRLVPGWVDTSQFVPVDDRGNLKKQLEWPVDRPILFTLRRLVPRMGLDRLLDACHRMRGEGHNFHLMIGGSGSLQGRLEEQTRALGLCDSVTFIGRVKDKDLPLAYAACDAFILPTAELECFGLIALEALSTGRPVLATPVGAIPEIILQFEPSWLARSAETEDIADLLRQYLTDNLPMHTPAKLHDRICRVYSREQVLDDFIRIATGKTYRI